MYALSLSQYVSEACHVKGCTSQPGYFRLTWTLIPRLSQIPQERHWERFTVFRRIPWKGHDVVLTSAPLVFVRGPGLGGIPDLLTFMRPPIFGRAALS